MTGALRRRRPSVAAGASPARIGGRRLCPAGPADRAGPGRFACLIISLVLAAAAPLAAAEARLLTLDRPGDATPPVVLPVPDTVSIVACDQFEILNFYCLRTAGDHEIDVLSTLSTGILAQGWTAIGSGDSQEKPLTRFFRAPPTRGECPGLIMIVSGASTGAGGRLPDGVVEIRIAQTVDIMCLFDGMTGRQS